MGIKKIILPVLLLLLAFSFIGMLSTIYQYSSFRYDTGFLKFKQQVIEIDYWRAAFYIHVFTCIICLLAGFTQFSGEFARNSPFLHRLFGRIYFYNIILINFPAGMILAIHANGNLLGKAAFILLGILWFFFTVAAVWWAKKRNYLLHRIFMIRSYALTLTALTLRFLKILMNTFSGWSYNEIYIFDAWMALAINLLVAEVIVRYSCYRSNAKLLARK